MNQEDLSGSNSRATANKNKIYKIINYLIITNFHIVFLGLKNDPSVPVLKEYIRINNLENKISAFNFPPFVMRKIFGNGRSAL